MQNFRGGAERIVSHGTSRVIWEYTFKIISEINVKEFMELIHSAQHRETVEGSCKHGIKKMFRKRREGWILSNSSSIASPI
jgi:hypothetical protein